MRFLLPLILVSMIWLTQPATAQAIATPPEARATMIEPGRLQAAAEMFAGRPVVVDPRLLLPACRNPALAWGPAARSVAISCAAPAWQVFVPLADGQAPTMVPTSDPAIRSRPAIRRGDRVTVETDGPGFVIGMAAVADADADARDGRVQLRPDGGGKRFTGLIGDDGRVRLTGLTKIVGGR
ncbi:MAG: hypothetical protein ACOYKQ_02595 [Polymorphobacter sp.]